MALLLVALLVISLLVAYYRFPWNITCTVITLGISAGHPLRSASAFFYGIKVQERNPILSYLCIGFVI